MGSDKKKKSCKYDDGQQNWENFILHKGYDENPPKKQEKYVYFQLLLFPSPITTGTNILAKRVQLML